MSMTGTTRRVKKAGTVNDTKPICRIGSRPIGPLPSGALAVDFLTGASTPRKAALALDKLNLVAVPLVPIGWSYNDQDGTSRPADDRTPAFDDWASCRPDTKKLARVFDKCPQVGVGLNLGEQPAGFRLVEVIANAADPVDGATMFLDPEGLPPSAGWTDHEGTHGLFVADERLDGLGPVVALSDGSTLKTRSVESDTTTLAILPPTPEADGTPREWNGCRWIAPLPEAIYAALLNGGDPEAQGIEPTEPVVPTVEGPAEPTPAAKGPAEPTNDTQGESTPAGPEAHCQSEVAPESEGPVDTSGAFGGGPFGPSSSPDARPDDGEPLSGRAASGPVQVAEGAGDEDEARRAPEQYRVDRLQDDDGRAGQEHHFDDDVRRVHLDEHVQLGGVDDHGQLVGDVEHLRPEVVARPDDHEVEVDHEARPATGVVEADPERRDDPGDEPDLQDRGDGPGRDSGRHEQSEDGSHPDDHTAEDRRDPVVELATPGRVGTKPVADGEMPAGEGHPERFPGEAATSEVVEPAPTVLGDTVTSPPSGSNGKPTSVESPAEGPTTSNLARNTGTWTAYDYLDADGVVRYQAVRSPSKKFHLRRPDPEAPGHWIKDIKGVGLVPYHLSDLIEADPTIRVYVTEGEKDCDRLSGLGLVATTNAMGAGKWRDEYNEHLQGRDVVVLADNDDPGRRHARQVADSLAGVAGHVKVLDLPGLPHKGDVSDWLDAGGTVAELEALVDRAPAESSIAEPDRRYDKAAVLEAARPHFTSLAGEFGLDIISKAPDDKGWRSCRAFDREDKTPSASINETSGVYHDFGTDEKLSFIALATRLKPDEFPDEQAVVAHLAERYGVAPLAADPFGGYGGDLPMPRPIRDELAPVPALPSEFLPAPFRGWLEDATERIGCSLEYLGVGAMVALAAVVGRRVTIRPKRLDDWTVVPNLWGGVVGRPGQLKTPALKEANRHLDRLVTGAEEQYTEADEVYEIQKVLAKAQAEAAKEDLKKALKANPLDQQKVEDLAARAAGHAVPDPPIRKRYVVNDTTVEKLGELLGENPNGLLLFRDELTGWLKTLEKPGHEADRAFFLESWNGTGSFTCDRIGRGTVHIPAACLSIMGGIQPGPLAQYLREAARGNGLADDGLISRLQLLVYPDPPGEWTNVDRYPDTDAKNRAFEVFRKLDELDPATIGAEADEKGGPPSLRFTPDAQEFFDAWREDLENTKLRAENESPLIESHLAKYRSLMPALALLFHLVDVVDGQAAGPVTLASARLAAAWCDFLEAHIRRIYNASFDGDREPARSLAKSIKAGRVPSPFTVRQVAQNDWSGLNTTEQVERAVGMLEQLDWLRGVEVATRGRPKTEYHINPLVERKGAS